MKYQPAIVVVAYNRPKSLERLLGSLKNAKKITDARLIISIDNKYPENLPIKKIAEDFEWPYGEKEVIYQEKRQGLRQHILKCGDLTEKYGSVIILEDDLYVSPYFYDYTIKALDFYSTDDKIGGISLYSQPREDLGEKPFQTIDDGSDVYFLQFPSSWGQAWSVEHWTKFREWLIKNPDISNIPISRHVINWPESSWKKLYCAYLHDQDKFFVYPRLSLTTNFNEPGTNYKLAVNNDGQAPLRLYDTPFRFINRIDSDCLYDSYFELKPEIVKKYLPYLKEYDFELDLYCQKESGKINKPYILTANPVRKYIYSFRRAMKPHELNILFDLKGSDLFFCEPSDIIRMKKDYLKELLDFKYFYTRYVITKKLLIYNFISKYNSGLLNKLFNKL